MPTRIGRTVTALAAAVLLATVAGLRDRPEVRGPRVTRPQPPGAPSARAPPTGTPSPSSTPTPDPVVLTANVEDGARKVTVDTLVKVKAKAGTLTKVKLTYRYTDRQGRDTKGSVAGALSKDQDHLDRHRPAGAGGHVHALHDRQEHRRPVATKTDPLHAPITSAWPSRPTRRCTR